MKRPMCILAVFWLAGLGFASLEISHGTNIFLVTYFLLFILGLLILKKYPRILYSHIQQEWYPKFTLLLFLLPCLFLGGFLRMEQVSEKQTQGELPWKLLEAEGETYVTVEGVIRSKKVEENTILELTDCVIIGYYSQKNQAVGDCRVRIGEEGKSWLSESFVGNTIRVFGTFSTFQSAGNPGQFDAYKYYSGQGLCADISALKLTVLDARKAWVGHRLFVLKQRLRESISSLYPEAEAGVLTAMLLGDKAVIPEEIEILYRQNGISHILAISGLHISMLCMGLFSVLRKLTVPMKASVALSSTFLIFYVVFTGASTSSVRAAIMCLVMFGAGLLRRSYDLLSSLAFAAIVVTAIQPMELTSAGFLLSFGAVLGVALAREAECRILEFYDGKRPWWCVFLFGGMIQCVTIPISLWFFYELSPYGIFLNLVVIPLVSLIIGGGLASAVLGLWWHVPAKLPVGGTYLLLEFYEWLCEIAQKLPFSYVLLGRPAVWQLVVYYGLLAIVLWCFLNEAFENFILTFLSKIAVPKSLVLSVPNFDRDNVSIDYDKKHFVTKQEIALLLGLLCITAILFLPAKRNAELIFLDVSQGDSALIITTEGTVILSDCGSSDVMNLAEYRLSPVLKQQGIYLIDMAVVSHLDNDHVSGIREVLQAMPVYNGDPAFAAGYSGAVGIKELVLPKVEKKSEEYTELEQLALQKNVTVHYIQAGDVLYQEKNFLIECLHPHNAKESDNDTSLVFLLQTPKLLAWLTGDAGITPEAEIMEKLAAVNMSALRENKTVLLKVGHHGSKTSSSGAFIEFIKPEAAVISCGYHNTYGHPHAEVVERLAASGAEVFRTDLQGAIIVNFDGQQGVVVHGCRKEPRK